MRIVLLIPLVLVAFWAWMFWEMNNNEDLPTCFITFSNGTNVRSDWTAVFFLLNIFAAGYYYFNVYGSKP